MNLIQYKEWEDAVSKIRDAIDVLENLRDGMEEELKEASHEIAGLNAQIEVLREKEP